jgi:hypothetical protein
MTGWKLANRWGLVPRYRRFDGTDRAGIEQRWADYHEELEQMRGRYAKRLRRRWWLPAAGPEPTMPPGPEPPNVQYPRSHGPSMDRYRAEMRRADEIADEAAAQRLRDKTDRWWKEAIEKAQEGEEERERLSRVADDELAAWVRLRDAWMDEEFLPALAEHVIWQATVDARERAAERQRARWFLWGRWVALGSGLAAAGGVAWWILS